MKKLILLCAVAGLGLSGCGSAKQPQTSEILNSAEMATGVDQSNLTIVENSVNVEGSGMYNTVNYKVKDKKGNTYRCYFERNFTLFGGTKSDSLCTKVGGSSSQKGSANCNKLLRKAGKC
ncbi:MULTISPECIES: hypothetical protein [unclassified Campylobacter]|uniref:hypothetical protein n=1 Tax=unclassified Campylobacter TaxID=2593542 RepID=UPI0022E9AFA3|nr:MULTISPECIES: hypothetical protein [unclassified Campylobacter]MDA3054741.1 hypothetical protein [Campylobacter sp. VBCF_07 NA4]MDA3059827.1 hypothetical protein [Campylobacter sp. VBCF_05 NA6]MDA3061226.1 hypothetical protein [Campylobacter sp. VBCF_02 NA5]MDA3070690.1 hypothetical protein [Campylobacter sp. VBCF_08 NA3]WBR54196.1 hypothetical protein PF027_07750 [Campylobacter sp. VBCF_01 NA2]